MARRADRILLAFAFVAACLGTATASDLGEHPRMPSQPHNVPALLYVGGAPERGAGRPSQTDRAALVARGHELYDTHCVSCHAANFGGSPGVPSIANDGGALVDFYLTTGRMPGAENEIQAVHQPAHFDAAAIAALDAYVSAHTHGVAIPKVTLDPTLLQRGRALFETNCQACHGAAGQGAIVGAGWVAIELYDATPTQIGEAIRGGPGRMPRFGPRQVSDRDVDALATYVRYLATDSPAYGGLTMDYLGPVAEGFVGGVLGVGTLFFIIYFTGTKADGTRLSER